MTVTVTTIPAQVRTVIVESNSTNGKLVEFTFHRNECETWISVAAKKMEGLVNLELTTTDIHEMIDALELMVKDYPREKK